MVIVLRVGLRIVPLVAVVVAGMAVTLLTLHRHIPHMVLVLVVLALVVVHQALVDPGGLNQVLLFTNSITYSNS